MNRGQPGELLFAFECGTNRYRCELRTQQGFAVGAQFWKNGEFIFGRMFSRRGDAIAWANGQRHSIENRWGIW